MDKELKEYIDKKVKLIILVVLECMCSTLCFCLLVLMNMTSINKPVYWVYLIGVIMFLVFAIICSVKFERANKQDKSKLASPAQQG